MSSIDINKTYRTRNGMEVVLYAIYPGQDYPVHGAINNGDGEWCVATWSILGNTFDGRENGTDLVEVKPRIKGEVWLNIYTWGSGWQTYKIREAADMNAQRGRIACVKFEYDVEEGEGLDDA